MNHDDRVMQTSGGRGGGNCWEMNSGPFYTPGRPSKNCKRPWNACSTWPHEAQEVTERTVWGARTEYIAFDGHWCVPS